MLAYKIYWRDEMGRDHLLGILPERRKLERITLGSIFAWARAFLPDKFDSISITPIFFSKNWKGEFLSNRSSSAYGDVN
jgi:hypothetical protein